MTKNLGFWGFLMEWEEFGRKIMHKIIMENSCIFFKIMYVGGILEKLGV